MIKNLFAAFVIFQSAILFVPVAQGARAVSGGTTATAVAKSTEMLPAAARPKNRGNNKKSKYYTRHQENLKRIKEGPIDLLFLGDSITDRWSGAQDVWKANFDKWHPANFGIGGDRTEGVLWRLENGELEGISPKVVVIMIGTNNTHTDSPEDIVMGIRRIIEVIQEKIPTTKILLLGVFPRESRVVKGKLDTMPIDKIRVINKELPKLAQPGKVRFLDITDKFLVDGKVPADVMPDQVHPSKKGYEIWAKAIVPVLDEMMK